MFELSGGIVVLHKQGCASIKGESGSEKKEGEFEGSTARHAGTRWEFGGRLQAHTGGETNSESQRVWSPSWPARRTPR